MTQKSFYRRALLFPFLVSAAMGLALLAHHNTTLFPAQLETIEGFATIIGFGGFFGMVPYSLVAVAIWKELDTELGVSRARAWLPWVPLAVACVGILMLLLMSIAKGTLGWIGLSYFFSLWTLAIGYGYVLLVYIALGVGRISGWITAEPRHSE